MNAGASPTGQAFAVRNCDALFSTTSRGKLDETAVHVQRVKAAAREQGREIDVYTVGVVTCRPTIAQAQEYYRHCVIENADWGAVDAIMGMRGVSAANQTPDEFQRIRMHTANGLGGLPLIGDPEGVADGLARLHAAGLTGIAVSFVNYADELPYFCDEVLPRLERLGLRERVRP
ncbi:MAG TPA: LLM class flavin-dependent oxidoreductase, partial [Beijerinckiaceae bacterium]|nr:LLM class flavin-dependent oxidoreductase [Beijerinckiaceae bacterium]